MVERITLYASEGMVVTDGTIYGDVITLAVGRNADDFYEITVEEFENIMSEKPEEDLDEIIIE